MPFLSRCSVVAVSSLALNVSLQAEIASKPAPSNRSAQSLKSSLKQRKPNIIFIMGDDLGYGDIGGYGQTKIKTPHLSRMAKEGMRFTQYYAGAPVCAPSRDALLTGRHTGHTFIRDNYEVQPEGQLPLPENTTTIGHVLQRHGYVTAAIGKWGLGMAGTTGDPKRQGFDYFYGYLCQRQAHNYYPTHLWRNGRKEILDGNEGGKQLVGKHYAHDLMANDALRFVRANRQRPFFLYLAFTIPHLALQVPEDSLAPYRGQFSDKPYDGSGAYLAHPAPRAAYAAMISRMDRDIGRLMDLLQQLNLDKETLVCFTSDNGPVFPYGGTDPQFFNSAGGWRGYKQDVFEGGIRVPFVARWPGHIRAGTVSHHVGAAWDMLPTFVELSGASPVASTDGISILPTLLSRRGQRQHPYLYWEYHGRYGRQGVRMANWKGVRNNLRENPNAPIQLFNLKTDPQEKVDVAAQHADVVQKIWAIMNSRRPSEIKRWNFAQVVTGPQVGQ